LVFLALIFMLARSHAAEKWSTTCWRSCWDDASSTKLSAKSQRLILQLPTVTPSLTVTIYPIHVDQLFSTPVVRATFSQAPFVWLSAVFQ